MNHSMTDSRPRGAGKNSKLGEALALARDGVAVFPCDGKIPKSSPRHPVARRHGVTAPWGATSSEAAVRDYWTLYPNANIGRPTGGGCFVLDVDTAKGGTIPDGCPLTWMVRTPSGGVHLYYSTAQAIKSNADGRVAPGVDVRCEGGMVIAAGSDGYEVVNPDTAIAPLPDWLAEAATRSPRRGTGPGGGAAGFAMRDAVPAGQRNYYLAQYAGWLLSSGYDAADLAEMLDSENVSACCPPLDTDEVEKVARSIARYGESRA